MRLLPGGQFQDFPTPNPAPGACPDKIVAGPDGNLWFQYLLQLSIGRLTTAGGYTEFPIPTGHSVHDIAAGVDGNLWFTGHHSLDGFVGRITPAGQVTVFPLPFGSRPGGIAAGPDGAIWFADGQDVGRINPGGPAPTVTRVTPSFGPDAGGTLVTILGTGFQSGATVSVGGVPATGVTVVDPTTITATTGPHVVGTVDVTVTNPGPQILTLPGGFFYAPPPSTSRFVPLTPCRIVDTRNANGPSGGPALDGNGARRTFVLAGSCGVPADAKTVSANVTVTQPAAAGSLTCFSGNAIPTGTTTIAFKAGQTRANNTMLYLATDGAGSTGVQNDATGPVHFIVDVNGYFR
jgi:IPT/TIG domain